MICNSFTSSRLLMLFSFFSLPKIVGSAASNSANALVLARLFSPRFSISRFTFSSLLASFAFTSSNLSWLDAVLLDWLVKVCSKNMAEIVKKSAASI